MSTIDTTDDDTVTLPTGGHSLWEAVFTVAPLVLVGTVDPDGRPDLAPKHQAMPLGWAGDYGFVCTEAHATYRNAMRTGVFTVSYPGVDRIVEAGQAAAPRDDGRKPTMAAIPTHPATTVAGVLVDGASLWLECEVERTVAGFQTHELVVGRIVAASAPRWAVRDPDRDDAELLRARPPLAYLCPTRFGPVHETFAFPFPADFEW